MGLFFGLFSIFIVLFYPRVLTNLICFGHNRDELRVKTKAGYLAIYAGWTILFMTPCLMLGSHMGYIGETPIDRAVYYFKLGKYDGSSVELGSEREENILILSYYTRGEINEELLGHIVQAHVYTYGWYDLEGLAFTQATKNYWKMSIGDEIMGYVETDDGLFLNKINYRWEDDKLQAKRREGGLPSDVPIPESVIKEIQAIDNLYYKYKN